MPVDSAQLLIFIPTALALILTPGSDMMFCLGQGMRSGTRAGIAASLGIGTGSIIHTLLAAFGLAALLNAYPLAFDAIRVAGVAYLVWLAIQSIRQPMCAGVPGNLSSTNVVRAWFDGVLVNLLNPKVAIFVLALIPQFIVPENGAPIVQFLIFGGIITVGGTLVTTSVAALSGGIGQQLIRNSRVERFFRYASAGIFMGLAARLAFDKR